MLVEFLPMALVFSIKRAKVLGKTKVWYGGKTEMRREGKSLFAKVEHGKGIGSQTQQKFQERPPQKAAFIKGWALQEGMQTEFLSHTSQTHRHCVMHCDVCMRGVILWSWGPSGEDKKQTVGRIITRRCQFGQWPERNRMGMYKASSNYLVSRFPEKWVSVVPDVSGRTLPS